MKPSPYYVAWEDAKALTAATAAVGGNVDKLRGDEARRERGFGDLGEAIAFAHTFPDGEAVLWGRYDFARIGSLEWDWKERQLDIPPRSA